MRRTIAAASILTLLAACGGHGSSLPPVAKSAAVAPSKGGVATTFTIKVPTASSTASSSRKPQYISPATASLLIQVDPGTPNEVDTNQSITSGSPGCTTPTPISPLTCTITLSVAPGAHTFNMIAYDATSLVLSSNFGFPFTVIQGTNNNIPIVLQGLPVGILVLAGSGQDVTGTLQTGFSLWGMYKADGATVYPRAFTIVSYDTDGNYIIGPGSPAITLTSSDNTTLSDGVANPNNPNQFTITPISYVTGEQYEYTATVTVSTTAPTNNGLVTTPISVPVPITITAPIAPRLYVANEYANNVTVYDGQGNTAISSFNVGEQPSGIAYDSHDAWLYVANSSASVGPGAVTAYDTSGVQQTLSGGFTSAPNPVGVVYDPHNQRLYVGWPNVAGSPCVSVFDEQGNPVSTAGTWNDGNGATPTYAFAYGGVYDPDNGDLYFADLTNRMVEVYDENGDFVNEWYDPNQPTSIVRSAATGWLYVATALGTVDVFDENGNPQTLTGGDFGTLAATSSGWGLAYDPGNGQFYGSVVGEPGAILAFDLNGNSRPLSGPFTGLDVPLGLTVVP